VCGIYGTFAAGGLAPDERGRGLAMEGLLRHRGPDQSGVHESAHSVLGSTRLAIVERTERAVQPFTSPDGRVTLVCNGEIYNAGELRRRYAARFPFRTEYNDIEPVLALYLDRGTAALDELDGMFALAVYDSREGALLLARDRAGEKPLFYMEVGAGGPGAVRFASEIQPLLAAADGSPRLAPGALEEYLTLGYTLAPSTLIDGIHSVPAGHFVAANAGGMTSHRYFTPPACTPRSDGCAPADLLECIDRVVEAQLQGDVPVGMFLSGGIDSSLLLSSSVRVRPPAQTHTYSARFNEPGFDESDHAAAYARRIGTRHRVVDASDDELFRALDTACTRIAEPVADPAILPSILLSEAAAEDVRVVLTGEGADELFGGYPTYLGHLWARRYRRLPRPLRAAVGAAVKTLPDAQGAVPVTFLMRRFVDAAEMSVDERHLRWFGALAAGQIPDSIREIWQHTAGLQDDVARAMRFDLATCLAENLFTKLDRATMLSSIEARAPFASRELLDLAMSFPAGTAVHGLTTKSLLKKAAAGRLPASIIRRRKRGLSVPVGRWLRTALADEATEAFSLSSLERLGIDPGGPVAAEVASLYREHLALTEDHGRKLWPLFVLHRWYDRWMIQAERARSAAAGGCAVATDSPRCDARSSVAR
jgi:asparagine synthase (glutamine-hydrolysing)